MTIAIQPITNLSAFDNAVALGGTRLDQKAFEDELARLGGGTSINAQAPQLSACAPGEADGVGGIQAARAHHVAYTPDGDTKGENPKLGSGGYKTDLPGGLPDAEAVFTGLSRLAGDSSTTTLPNTLRPDILQRSYPSGIQLRIGADLVPRIDIPAGTFTLTKPETIHFTGGKGNMCPTN